MFTSHPIAFSRLPSAYCQKFPPIIRASSKDSRKRKLGITKRGRELIVKNDTFVDQIFETHAAKLTKSELSLLVRYMKDVSDANGQLEGIPRPNESDFRVQQRRITRAYGLLGEHVFGSNLSSSKWHALSEIVESPVPLQVAELADLLSVAQNSISTVISWLEKERLIKREGVKSDKRASLLRALPKGVKAYREIQALSATQIDLGIAAYSKKTQEDLVKVVTKFVGEGEGIWPPLLPSYETVENDSEDSWFCTPRYLECWAAAHFGTASEYWLPTPFGLLRAELDNLLVIGTP